MYVRVYCVVILSLFSLAGGAVAQTDDGTLAEMRETWTQLNQSMSEKFEALDNGDMTPGLADEYRDLVDEAKDLIERMREQGMVELSKNSQDTKLIQTLLGIMVHDAQEGLDAEVLQVGDALIGARVNPKYFEKAASLDRLEMAQKRIFEELIVRHREAIADDLPRVKLETSKGEIIVELFENEAPNTVRNFVSLVESGFYDGKLFHRVIDEFMAQTGGYESKGIGSGDPGYEIECECRLPDARLHFTGSLSMAHAGRDTGGSQFYITFRRTDHLDGKHTVFGRVISGAEVLESIERTTMSLNGTESELADARLDRIKKASVLRKRDHSYRFRKKGEPELSEEPDGKDDLKKDDSELSETDQEAEQNQESEKESKSDESEMKKDDAAADSKKDEGAEKPAEKSAEPESKQEKKDVSEEDAGATEKSADANESSEESGEDPDKKSQSEDK
jgi:cyclophilin family peptidyl-prolyl cis-trans isomerase